MNLEEKLQRSKSKERIDFSKFQSNNTPDPIVRGDGVTLWGGGFVEGCESKVRGV